LNDWLQFILLKFKDDEQQMTNIPQPVANNPVDQVDHQIPENDEQLVEQHDPQENIGAKLRKSTRVKKIRYS